MNYYNEFDPNAAAWLRELIAAGEIPAGEVDERSICDVQPTDLVGFAQHHFFAGVGGWSLALRLADWDNSRSVWTGSCPCQPFSAAGKGRGVKDERHLWPEFARLIAECQPAAVFGEQVASKAGREWLAGVRADLEGLGYAVGAADLCAASVGAPHIRQRLFWGGQRLQAVDTGLSRRTGVAGWLGVANSAGLQPGEFAAASARHGRAFEPASCINGLGNAASDRPEMRSYLHAELQGQGFAERHEPSDNGLAYGSEPGLERQSGNGDTGNEPGWLVAHATRPATEGGWSNFGILPFRDGKARRVERGTFPLVDGLPRGVVLSGDPSAQEAQATAEARVMRLKGYGNAIAPQVAAEFIRAFVDCEN